MISIQGLCKDFDGQVVLDDVNLEIGKGEIIAVLGESGVGKSVLLKNMMGLLTPSRGTVSIDGQVVTGLKEDDLLKVREKIGYLFQEGALYDFMNVYENVAFPLQEHTQLNEAEIQEKVQHALQTVDLEGVEEKMPSELSGGMKKRVGLARAIILDSKILFCDEPTSGLDPIRSRDISDLIKNISRKLNCTVVFTSHDISNAFRIADRVAIIRGGKILAFGREDDLRKIDDPFVKDFLQ